MPRTQFARPLLDDPLRRVLEAPEPEHESPAPAAVQRTMTVGAADDRAEHEADAIADQVLARLAVPHQHDPGCGHHDAVRRTPTTNTGTSTGTATATGTATGTATIGAAGGDLDTHTTTTIENARGTGTALPAPIRREMETGFGHSLADIRIHTDNRAAHLNRTISARAFTTGRDIFFGAGEYAPHTTDGKRVLAHEIAHTRQGHGIRRKLRGTAQALVAQGEVNGDKGKSSGFLRKAIGSLTNWDKIVAGVKAYEAEEARLLSKGNPDPMTLAGAKTGLLQILTSVQGHIAEWRRANPTSEPAPPAKGKKATELKSDDRTKAPRRQALAMLEPRVGHEIRLLSAKDGAAWLSGLGLSTQQVVKTGESDSGEKNTVNQIDYRTEQGDFSGYFKQDKGFNHDREGHERRSGIEQVDPNYGARNVALYRLDRLLDAGVIARAEFAVHTDGDGRSSLGTVMEKAKGTQGGKLEIRKHGDRGVGGVGLDDPKLQSGLNKLQIMDAIAGQLDRHLNNYFVDTDTEGNVTSVTGIDNDMAFGAQMLAPDQEVGAHHYRKLPEYVDKVLGEKILAIKESDLRDALNGLLPQAEIDATVSRFLLVQQHVKIASRTGRLQETWDKSTAQRGLQKVSDTQFMSTQKSYQDGVKGRFVSTSRISAIVVDEAGRTIRDHRSWGDLPEDLTQALHKALNLGYEGNPLIGVIRQQTMTHLLSEQQMRALANALLTHLLDRMNADRYAVELQEMSSTPDELKALATKLGVELQGLYQALGTDGMNDLCTRTLGRG